MFAEKKRPFTERSNGRHPAQAESSGPIQEAKKLVDLLRLKYKLETLEVVSNPVIKENETEIAKALRKNQQEDDFAIVFNHHLSHLVSNPDYFLAPADQLTPTALRTAIDEPDNSLKALNLSYERALRQAVQSMGETDAVAFKELARSALKKLAVQWEAVSESVSYILNFLDTHFDQLIKYYQEVQRQFPRTELPPNTEALDAAEGRISEVTICINLGITQPGEVLSWNGVRQLLVARYMYLARGADAVLHVIIGNEVQQQYLEKVFLDLIAQGAERRQVTYSIDEDRSSNLWIRDQFLRTTNPQLSVVTNNVEQRSNRVEQAQLFRALPDTKLSNATDQDHFVPAPLWLEGGDITVTGAAILIGDKTMAYNRNLLGHDGQPASTAEVISAFQDFFHKPTLFIGREATPVNLGDKFEVDLRSFTIYHQDLYLTPLGESATGKQQIAVADADQGLRLLVEAYGDTPGTQVATVLQSGILADMRQLAKKYAPTTAIPAESFQGLLADIAPDQRTAFTSAIEKLVRDRENFNQDLLAAVTVDTCAQIFDLKRGDRSKLKANIKIEFAPDQQYQTITLPLVKGLGQTSGDFAPVIETIRKRLHLPNSTTISAEVNSAHLVLTLPRDIRVELNKLSAAECMYLSNDVRSRNAYASIQLFLEGVTRQLAEQDFDIIRLPYLPTWPKSHTSLMTWNNGLVENFSDDGQKKRRIELPRFGVPVLENAVQIILQKQGFDILFNDAAWPLLWGDGSTSGVDGIVHCATLEQRQFPE